MSAYRRSTGVGTFEAMLDVQALATYPQMWTKPGARSAGAGPMSAPSPVADGSASPSGGAVDQAQIRVPGSADAQDLVVPQDWLDEKLPADRPFELEVVRDETTVRVSSDDLPPFLRDQLTALVRDGRVEDAALELFAAHGAHPGGGPAVPAHPAAGTGPGRLTPCGSALRRWPVTPAQDLSTRKARNRSGSGLSHCGDGGI